MSLENIEKQWELLYAYPKAEYSEAEAINVFLKNVGKLLAVAKAAMRLKNECADLCPDLMEALAALEKE